MKSHTRRFASLATTALPIVVALALHGCDSPVAPKFPDPVEKEDTITNDDDGATRRPVVGRMTDSQIDSLRRHILKPCREANSCR